MSALFFVDTDEDCAFDDEPDPDDDDEIDENDPA
jgi:hypothetical protein